MFFELAAVFLASVMMVTTSAKGKKTTGLPIKSNKNSPKKKALVSIRITDETLKDKRKQDYHLRIVKLRPDFEMIWIDASPGNDGYGQKLYDHVTNDDGFRAHGVIMVAKRRVSLQNPAYMTNAKDNYPRRCIIRFLQDDEESTHTSRLAILNAFRAFLVRPEHNQFNYDYVVNGASDLTPVSEEDLQPMDHVLNDSIIVNIMCTVFQDTGSGWYDENSECALDFFSGPTFPTYAVDRLGYPAGGIEANNGP